MRRFFATLITGCLLLFPFFISGTSKIVISATSIKPSGGRCDSVFEKASEWKASILIDSLKLDEKGLNKQTLEYALKGFKFLQGKGILHKTNVLTICDFSQSSKKKRLYIIDMDSIKLILNTYVAHGKNSGIEYAGSFSNTRASLKSSLGFYITLNTYHGSHGLSLKIEGLERGFNDKANNRNIVVHGADYVGPDFLRFNAFTGRSYGCPAVPASQTPLVINTIKNGSCLFIYHPTQQYLKKSKILNS